MNKQEAIQIRMLNQQLLSPLYERPEGIVAWQGAMQAQDYNYFRWAIGIRQRIPQIAQLQAAFAKAELLRLHLLRCTVQVVSQTDIGWLLPFDCPDYARKVLLLPPYDEYLIGYKSRWVALEKKHTAKAHNNFGIFKPVILHEGRVVGNWKASIDKQGANLITELFAEKSKVKQQSLQDAINQFVEFCKVTTANGS